MKIQKSVIFVKKNLKIDILHSICNLKYSVLKKNPVAIHNGSKYYYHFIAKELVNEFKKHLLV